MTAVRYTAVIKVVRVDPAPPPPRGNVPGKEQTQDTEMANMVVRAKTLPKLISAVKAHLDLVEEAG